MHLKVDKMERIKIGLFVPWLKSKGGVEKVISAILKDKNFDITVYTLFYRPDSTFDEFRHADVKVIGNLSGEHFLSKGFKLGLFLLTHKIEGLDEKDIFLISTAGVSEITALRNRHRRTVALCHTPLRAAHSMYDYYRKRGLKYRILLPPVAGVYKYFEKASWKNIKYALVLSEEVKTRLVKYGLMENNRIFKLGPVVDYNSIKKTVKPEKIILYNSRFTPYKRQELAILAFRRSKLKDSGFRLILSGFIEDKGYFDKINRLVSGNTSIEVIPNLSGGELASLYKKCYATLFLAVNEDTGLVPLESLAYGKPVISVNEGGPKEFIKNMKNGLLVKADADEIASAMNKLSNKKIYGKLRKGALSSKVYDERAFLANFDSAIKKIVNKV